MDYLRIQSGKKEITSEFEERLVRRMESGETTHLDNTDNAIQLAKADLNKIPAYVEDETANQLCALKYYDDRLFSIILDDIKNAYKLIESELGEKYPDWKKQFPLTDINLSVIEDDEEWKKFRYLNELDNLRLPCCASAIIPIRLRFKKQNTNLRYAMEIEFIDVICLVGDKKPERMYYLHSTYTQK